MITALSLNLPCSKGVRPHHFIFIFPAVEEYSHVSSDHFSSSESNYDALIQASQSPLSEISSNYTSSCFSVNCSPATYFDFDGDYDLISDFGDVDESDISDFLLSSNLFDTA